MLAPSDSPRPGTLDELLGPALMRKLDRLDVMSRKIFAGKMPGERRSKKRGSSVEFDDYREYVPGDDLRRLDWNVYARFDRLIIKLFREEEDLSVHLVLDASASMDAGEPSKLSAAMRLAMGLGYIGLVKQNRVSASVFGVPGHAGVRHLAPLRGRRGVHELGHFFLTQTGDQESPQLSPSSGRDGALSTGGKVGPFNAALRNVALARRGKGVMIVLSDGLVREDLRLGLNDLAAGAGFDTTFLQIVDPLELDPALGVERGLVGDLRLTDIETRRASELTITAPLLKAYKRKAEAYIEMVRLACAARGMGHVLVKTTDDPADILLGSLRRRGVLG
jgi:uncharacterized protein (DUF58 family)